MTEESFFTNVFFKNFINRRSLSLFFYTIFLSKFRLNVVIAVITNAWDGSAAHTKENFWRFKLTYLFGFSPYMTLRPLRRMFFRLLGDRSLFAYMDRNGERVMHGTPSLFDYLVFIYFLPLGLVTFGVFWSKSLRRYILSLGYTD